MFQKTIYATALIILITISVRGHEARMNDNPLQTANTIDRPADNEPPAGVVVHGHVLDAKTGEHLPYTNILIKGSSFGVAADESGHYSIRKLPEGSYKIQARAMGYKSQVKQLSVEKDKQTHLNFELHPDYINAEGVVITANRNEVNRKDATTIVNVLDSETLETTSSANVAEGLSFQPGVRVENNCQNCGFTQLRMNGLEGPYTQILIDGHAVMSALSNVYGLEQIPADMIQRIEVVRGGGSVLYGSNAIAGTVNIITKEPSDDSFEASANMSFFDRNTTGRLLSFNSSLVNDDKNAGLFLFAQLRNRDAFNANPGALWDKDADGVKETKDGFSELSKMNMNSFGFRGYLRPAKQQKLSLEYHHLGEFRRGGNDFELVAHMADIAEQVKSNVDGGSIEYDFLSENLKHDVSLYNSMQAINRETYYGAEQDPNAYGKTYELTNNSGVQYTGYFDKLLFARSTLVAGVEYKYSDLEDDKIGTQGATPIIRQEIRNLGAFVESEWELNRMRLKAGARIDRHSLLDQPVISPRINILYDVLPSTQLRLTYSEGFRAPQVFDEDLHIEVSGAQAVRTINSENLEEEKSSSYSASVDYSGLLAGWQSYFLVEGFYTQLNDQFVKEIQINENGQAFLFRKNGSGAKVFGLNLEGKLAASEKLQFSFGFTTQKSRYSHKEVIWEPASGNADSLVSTKNILRTPENYGYFTASWNPWEKVSLSLNGTYTGSMLVPHMINPVNEYTVISESRDFFDIGFKLTKKFNLSNGVNISVYGGVKNLLDQFQDDFDAGINRDSGYIYGPALPQTFLFGVKFGG